MYIYVVLMVITLAPMEYREAVFLLLIKFLCPVFVWPTHIVPL